MGVLKIKINFFFVIMVSKFMISLMLAKLTLESISPTLESASPSVKAA
jgi:hypothetical protein